MISLFRNFFQSKIGLPIFIGFLVIVALAFAAADISGTSTFGGLTGDDKVVSIGGESVTSNELSAAVRNGYDRARAENPTLTLQQFIEQGGLESELELYIDRYAVALFAQEHGLRAGDNLVNSEILQIPAFRNLTGEFDQASYQAALRQQGLTDAVLRRDIADGLLNQQVLRAAFAAPHMPRMAARQYAALVLERRQGDIALIPSRQYAPEGDPTAEQLSEFYDSNRGDFILPERRTIRFARFGSDDVNVDLTPTPQQIAARYEQDADQYEAQERRAISSFVVPTEAAARTLVERIRSGVSLDAAAAQAGFNVSTSELRDRAELASATSAALAEKVFAAGEGDVVEPARSQLGFYVARVNEVESIPARSLEQVRGDISQQLQDEARAAALEELSVQVEELVDGGTSLSEVATELGLELNTIPNVLADGSIYGTPGQTVPEGVRPIVDTAFAMDESDPQLAELVPGQQFMIFDVEDVVPSAAPPIAEVREEVIAAWRRSEGSKEAREVAGRILAAVRGGKSLPEAMREEDASLDQLEQINLERRQLLANQQRGIPTALVLMFSMAEGSTKLLEDQNDLGWFIVNLEDIITPEIEDDNPVLDQTQQQIGSALSLEYNQQLMKAIREAVGVERNEEAIEALRRSLLGQS